MGFHLDLGCATLYNFAGTALQISEPSNAKRRRRVGPDAIKTSASLCCLPSIATHLSPSVLRPLLYSKAPLEMFMRSKRPKRISKMKAQSSHLIALFFFFFFLLFCGFAAEAGEALAGLADKCSKDFNKVVSCLNYAKGIASTPTKDCCTSVKEIRDDDPVCLCYVIQQTHNGSEQIKNFGLKEERLLQLPTACSLKNASVTNCPGLLGLSPSSPDAAIFTNASTATPTPSTGTSSAQEAAKDSNIGSGLGPNSAGLIATAITILFLFAFPVGSPSAATFELGST